MVVVAGKPAPRRISQSTRFTLRLIVASAFIVIALIFFTGRAHADDNTTASTPAAESTPAPATSDSTPPPTGAQQEPASPTPAGADGPQPNNDQNAAVTSTGTGLANTGANAADASGTPAADSSGTPAPAPSGTASTPGASGDAKGSVTTGTSDAVGSDSKSGIDQKATAKTTDNGTVDVLQIGLVVNIGVGNANSGNNVAGASTGSGAATGTAKGSVQTGNAGALGNGAKTGVTQSAVIGNGDVSSQKAIVLNVGIAIGNSGLNITIGRVDNNNTKSATTMTGGRSTGQVYTGGATAIGDMSKSNISQVAGGLAKGNATLVIDQRALVVNFGVALANSGGNIAFATFDKSQLTPEQAQIVEAVLGILAPFFAPANGASGSLGSANAQIKTGTAGAIGNGATTNIVQQALGSADGNNYASAHQVATVGNLGLAIANSGLNGAIATTGSGLTPAGAQLAAAQNGLATFLSLLTNLDWLNSPNPFAQFAQTVKIGDVTLDLGGTLQGAQFLMGWDSAYAPDGGPIPGGVRVRQISGVINIGISTSNSGENLVIATVDGTHHEGNGDHALADNGSNSGFDALAKIVTGNAVAFGNMSKVGVCQAFHDTVTCAVKTTTHAPPPHAQPPVVLAASEERAPTAPAAADPASAGAALPFTGTDTNAPLELAGALIALGAAFASRRRRDERV